MRYDVNFTLSGCMIVYAETELEAIGLVEDIGDQELSRHADLEIGSVEEVTE